MTNEAKEESPPQVVIPLNSEADQKESAKKRENIFSICGSCFCFFLKSTSIKGGKQVSGTKLRCLRWFWILFVCLSFALVITILSKVFIRYSEYNTVIRQSIRGVYGRDLPIITMCSNAFFGDSKGVRQILQHQDFYFKMLQDKARKSIQEKKYTEVKKYQELATIERYNARNVHLWEELSKDILKTRARRIGGSMVNFYPDQECIYNKDKKCVVEPFLNLKYRNCISIKIKPKDMADETRNFVFRGMLLTKRDDIGVPVDDESAYPSSRQIDVFLHDYGSIPKELPDFMFSVPRNRWVYLDLGITHLRRLKTPRFTCLSEPIARTNHVKEDIRLASEMCREVKLRSLVREKCDCESLTFPYDKWPLGDKEFCGVYNENLTRMSQQYICENNVLFNADIVDRYKPCPIACSQKHFDSKISVNDFDDDALSAYYRNKYVYGISKMLSGCLPKRKLSKAIQMRCKALLKTLDILTKNKTLRYEDIIQSGIFPDKSTYWKKAKPAMPEASNSKMEFEKKAFFVMFRVPKVSILKEEEKLVQTIWTTMAQAGGACSFLAGFTFVVIAEVIDTCITFWRKRRSRAT